jgi:hypothetical protein
MSEETWQAIYRMAHQRQMSLTSIDLGIATEEADLVNRREIRSRTAHELDQLQKLISILGGESGYRQFGGKLIDPMATQPHQKTLSEPAL